MDVVIVLELDLNTKHHLIAVCLEVIFKDDNDQPQIKAVSFGFMRMLFIWPWCKIKRFIIEVYANIIHLTLMKYV